MNSCYRISRYELSAGDARTFHPGRRYLLLFVVDGSCRLSANGKKWLCRSPDMFLLKPGQTQTFDVTIPLTIDGITLTKVVSRIQWNQNKVMVRNAGAI